MERVSKSICLTEIEYRILLNWYEINELTGFKMSDPPENEQIIQEMYNLGVFSLYKKGLIKSLGEEIIPDDSIERIFRPLSKCKFCICIESEREDLSSYCLYYGKNLPIIVMEPGSRKEEYAKLQCLDPNHLKDFLIDLGIIKEEAQNEEILSLKKEDDLDIVINTEEVFVVKDANRDSIYGKIEILESVVSQKLVILSEERNEEYPYTANKTVEEIFKMVESYDIS